MPLRLVRASRGKRVRAEPVAALYEQGRVAHLDARLLGFDAPEALALGVPPMLLGIPGDNTYSRYQEANRSFWRQAVLPLVTRTVKALSAWLDPAFGEDLQLRPDLDRVEALAPARARFWVQEGTLWAEITPVSGSERIQGDRRTGQVSQEITMRYRPCLTADMRFRHNTRIFRIGAVLDIGERHAFLRCLCTEEDL